MVTSCLLTVSFLLGRFQRKMPWRSPPPNKSVFSDSAHHGSTASGFEVRSCFAILDPWDCKGVQMLLYYIWLRSYWWLLYMAAGLGSSSSAYHLIARSNTLINSPYGMLARSAVCLSFLLSPTSPARHSQVICACEHYISIRISLAWLVSMWQLPRI